MTRVEEKEFQTAHPPGSYCKVYVNYRTDSLNPIDFNKPAWLEGIVVAAGAKRTRVELGRKVVKKRNRFVRSV